MAPQRQIPETQQTITRRLRCGCTLYGETLYDGCAEEDRLQRSGTCSTRPCTMHSKDGRHNWSYRKH